MLAEVLTRLLASRPGLNRKMISELTGMTPSYVSDLFSGKKKKPSETVLFKLAQVLDVDLATLRGAAGLQTENQKPRSIVIGIAGPSCAGKSFVTEKFRLSRPDDVTVISLDSYYKAPEFVSELEFTHDNPNAVDLEQAALDLVRVVNGQEVRVPHYDFKNPKVRTDRLVVPRPIVIIEGLFTFASRQLLNQIDIKLWIEAGETVRFSRRIERDITERGRTIDSVRTKWREDVVHAHQKFLQYYRPHADLIVVNDYEDPSKIILIVDMVLGYLRGKNGRKPGVAQDPRPS